MTKKLSDAEKAANKKKAAAKKTVAEKPTAAVKTAPPIEKAAPVKAVPAAPSQRPILSKVDKVLAKRKVKQDQINASYGNAGK